MFKYQKIILVLFFLLIIIPSCKVVLREKIEGYVYDYQTKKPIADVCVLSYTMDTLSVTDAQGYFLVDAIIDRDIPFPAIEKKALSPHSDIFILKKGKLCDTINIYTQTNRTLPNNTLFLDTIWLPKIEIK